MRRLRQLDVNETFPLLKSFSAIFVLDVIADRS